MAAIYARAVPTFSPRLRGFSEPVAGSAIFPLAHDGTYCSGSLRTVDPGRTADQGPRTQDDAQDRGPWTGPRTQDLGRRTSDAGPRTAIAFPIFPRDARRRARR